MCTKISKPIGLLYKARCHVTRKLLLSLYFSLVYPYLTYCNVGWSSTYPTNINSMYLVQPKESFEQSVLQITEPVVNPFLKNLAFLTFIVCFNSKSDRSCTCTTMKCYPSLFKTYFKLLKIWTQESFQKEVEFDRPGERSPE